MDAQTSGLALLQCYSDSDTESNHGAAEISPIIPTSKGPNELEDSSPKSCQQNTIVSRKSVSVLDSGSIETSNAFATESSAEMDVDSNNFFNLSNPTHLVSQTLSKLESGVVGSSQEFPKIESKTEPFGSVNKPDDSLPKLLQESKTAVEDYTTSEPTKKPKGILTNMSVDDTDPRNLRNLVNSCEGVSQCSLESLPATANFSESYRQPYSSDSDSDSSSDESIISVPTCPVIDDWAENEDGDNNVPGTSKMLADLGLLDLPPLEDLVISVPETECIPIGTVSNIIDLLVLVTAKRGTPAVDTNSVLFLDNGKKTLGQVFDVFGQVNEPIYMVRFNSPEHISENGIEIGMEVFFAPRTPHTAFVFIDALLKMKGSDASWEHDQEPPEGCVEYSDDEEERKAKAAHRMRRNASKQGEEGSSQVPRPKKQRQGQQFNRRHNESSNTNSSNPFYMQPNQQYYTPHQSQANMWTNHPGPSWGPSQNSPPPSWGPSQNPPVPSWGPPPNPPPPPYMYQPFGGPQFPPPS